MSLKEVHESFPSSNRGPIHEGRRLQIEELDEWQTHKLRTHDKPKLCQNEFNTFPHQLKVGDKFVLDAADPHIFTTTPNGKIPLTVLSIFPFGTVEVSHPKFVTFKSSRINRFSTETRPSTRACLGPCENRAKISPNTGYNKMPRPYDMVVVEPAKTTWACNTWKNRGYHVIFTRKENYRTCFQETEASSFTGPTAKIRHPLPQFPQQVQLADAIRAVLTTDLWKLFFGIIEPTYLELTMKLCSTFHLQTVMTNYEDPGTAKYRLGRLICQLGIPEFGAPLGLYTKEFKEENELHTLTRHIHFSPSKYWHTLAPGAASYNPSHSKASVLPPSLRHVIDLAYFISLAIQHQTERYKKGVISIGPFVTRLARHFRLLDTAAQESSLTLIGQISPQGISSMLSMRMIKRRRGTYPPQYHLTQSTEEKAYEDIPDDVPP
ncbi:hypothetical protein GOBAR_AA03248 [Gossypium barbadense]|uniref:Uncharacterized protein n=1 Tax=Gossypium barbadense TaxID=3634 RepID=A0A2P5YP10_GOSBA|nr:hypothetical protein GOBAR_AA03248 [Gossypium barbadense]